MEGIVEGGGVEIQERDRALLRDLFESRVMTLGHLAAIHFEGKREAAKKRIQKLKTAGLIRERPRRVNEPSVLFVTQEGFRLLLDAGVLADRPRLTHAQFERRVRVSDLTIRHELEVMDVKAAFVSALRGLRRYELAEFCTWPRLYEFRACRSDGKPVLVQPDGFVRIREREADGGLSEHTFFLEVDRSTETLDVLVEKAVCYRDFYRRGGFAVRNGTSAEDFASFPFRVLMVLQSSARASNVARRLLQLSPPILTQIWLSTFDELRRDALDAIWSTPRDHRGAADAHASGRHLMQ